jgi:hypothetical protein
VESAGSKILIKLECIHCDRYGEIREDRYFEITGTKDKADARLIFAKRRGCERAIKQVPGQVHDLCQIRYVLD